MIGQFFDMKAEIYFKLCRGGPSMERTESDVIRVISSTADMRSQKSENDEAIRWMSSSQRADIIRPCERFRIVWLVAVSHSCEVITPVSQLR
jgi:hypothetical protein